MREFYYDSRHGLILFEFETEAVTFADWNDSLANRCRCWNAHWGEPAVAIRFLAAGEREEFVLDSLGDGTSRPIADGDTIDGANRGDFHSRPAEEELVGDVEHFARNDLFGDRNVEVAAELHDSVASDSGKSASSRAGA